MAERVPDDTVDFKTRAAKYPWDLWFDGKTWLLTPGEDFDISSAAFTAVCHQAAKRRNGMVRTATRKTGLYLRFTPGDKT